MARKPRVEYEGAIYHVMSRGDRREAIFRDDTDRRRFMRALGEACGRTGWRVHAYVLMSNHYHLLLETPHANLAKGMHWFQSSYTLRFNARHRLSGHVFQGRYKAIPVEAHRDYLFPLADYIHLNPVRAGLINQGETLEVYPWSSLPQYVDEAKRPEWLECGCILGEMGTGDAPGSGNAYLKHLRERVREEVNPNGEERESWFVGSKEFGARLLEKLKSRESAGTEKAKVHRHAGDYGELMAERIASDGLSGFGITDEMLQGLPKSDWRKRIVGHAIKTETSVSLDWISRRLKMGAVSHVSTLCGNIDDLRGKQGLPPEVSIAQRGED
ncbi:MAG: transposase [Phycisphaerae bacterium]